MPRDNSFTVPLIHLKLRTGGKEEYTMVVESEAGTDYKVVKTMCFREGSEKRCFEGY